MISDDAYDSNDCQRAPPVSQRGVTNSLNCPTGGHPKACVESTRTDGPRTIFISKTTELGWDGADDPGNPCHWTLKRRWAVTLIVSAFGVLAPVSSSMVAPALPQMSVDLSIDNETETLLIVTLFVLPFGLGPLFVGPLSEKFGRKIVLLVANAIFFFFNLGCGFARTGPQMLIMRFFAGLGGSAPLSIGGGVIGDCWPAEQRSRAISVYSIGPILGPAIGPIAGGFIGQYASSWRWIFWSTTIMTGVVQAVGHVFLQETWAPLLIERRSLRRNKEGNVRVPLPTDDSRTSLTSRLITSVSRPFVMIATQPIVQALALYMAYLYGICYLALATFPQVWSDIYGEGTAIGGLNYISQGLGYFLGAQISWALNDRIYNTMKRRNNGIGRPEYRVLTLIPSCLLTPVGLFWYGWSAQARIHWIMPNIGSVIFGAGIITGALSIQNYLISVYTTYAASSLAANNVLRGFAAFGFPLFAPRMYDRLGYGWGNSFLGFLAIIIGIPASLLLWRYGRHLRQRSPYAANVSD